MRSTIQSQSFGSIGAEANLGISSANVFRKPAVSKSLPAKPTMANCLGRTSSWARLQSAGMSLRLVRSPVAPKMAITHGDAVGFMSEWFRLMREISCLRPGWLPKFLVARFLFDVSAELEAHRGQNFGREISFAARRESLEQRRREY